MMAVYLESLEDGIVFVTKKLGLLFYTEGSFLTSLGVGFVKCLLFSFITLSLSVLYLDTCESTTRRILDECSRWC